MHVTVYLTGKHTLEVENFDEASALDLKEAFEERRPTLTLDMDGATVVVNTDHVIRIDFETGTP